MNNVIAKQNPLLARALGIDPTLYQPKKDTTQVNTTTVKEVPSSQDELKTSKTAKQGNKASSVNLFKSIPQGALEGGGIGLAAGLAIGSTMSGLGALVPVMAGVGGGLVVGAVTRPLVDKHVLSKVDKDSTLGKAAQMAQVALDVTAGVALTGGAGLMLAGLAPEAAQVAVANVAGKALTVGAIGVGVATLGLVGIGAYAAYQHLSK